MTDDELCDELAEALGRARFKGLGGKTEAEACDYMASALLPVVRRFADAQVAAERERIAIGLQRLAQHVMNAEIDEGLELLAVLAAGQLPGLERRQP